MCRLDLAGNAGSFLTFIAALYYLGLEGDAERSVMMTMIIVVNIGFVIYWIKRLASIWSGHMEATLSKVFKRLKSSSGSPLRKPHSSKVSEGDKSREIVERETDKESPVRLLGCKKEVEADENSQWKINFNAVEVGRSFSFRVEDGCGSVVGDGDYSVGGEDEGEGKGNVVGPGRVVVVVGRKRDHK
jgi:hypothetical protein